MLYGPGRAVIYTVWRLAFSAPPISMLSTTWAILSEEFRLSRTFVIGVQLTVAMALGIGFELFCVKGICCFFRHFQGIGSIAWKKLRDSARG